METKFTLNKSKFKYTKLTIITGTHCRPNVLKTFDLLSKKEDYTLLDWLDQDRMVTKKEMEKEGFRGMWVDHHHTGRDLDVVRIPEFVLNLTLCEVSNLGQESRWSTTSPTDE